MKKITAPITAVKRRGATEKQVMPSTAYLNSDENFHEVLPSWRSTVLKDIHLVSKPTHEKMPFEKRWTSLSSRIESTIWRVIMR